jgi:hypothetical protein
VDGGTGGCPEPADIKPLSRLSVSDNNPHLDWFQNVRERLINTQLNDRQVVCVRGASIKVRSAQDERTVSITLLAVLPKVFRDLRASERNKRDPVPLGQCKSKRKKP